MSSIFSQKTIHQEIPSSSSADPFPPRFFSDIDEDADFQFLSEKNLRQNFRGANSVTYNVVTNTIVSNINDISRNNKTNNNTTIEQELLFSSYFGHQENLAL